MKFRVIYWEEYNHETYTTQDLEQIKSKITKRKNVTYVGVEDTDNPEMTRLVVVEKFKKPNPLQAIVYTKEQTEIALSDYWSLYIIQDNEIELPLATEEI